MNENPLIIALKELQLKLADSTHVASKAVVETLEAMNLLQAILNDNDK